MGYCNHDNGFSHCSECCDESTKKLESENERLRREILDNHSTTEAAIERGNARIVALTAQVATLRAQK